jgi:hypothetical protein
MSALAPIADGERRVYENTHLIFRHTGVAQALINALVGLARKRHVEWLAQFTSVIVLDPSAGQLLYRCKGSFASRL